MTGKHIIIKPLTLAKRDLNRMTKAVAEPK